MRCLYVCRQAKHILNLRIAIIIENCDDNELILNKMLVKILWFYENVISETVKCRGRYNFYKSIFVILMLYQCLVSLILCLSGFYYWTKNTIQSMMYLMISINIVFANYKMYNIAYYSGDIWKCLSITQFNFTNYGHQHRRILDLRRNLSIRLTYTFKIMCFLLVIGMAMYPLAFGNTFLQMKDHDGLSSNYRLNVLNLNLLFSEETYNTEHILLCILHHRNILHYRSIDSRSYY